MVELLSNRSLDPQALASAQSSWISSSLRAIDDSQISEVSRRTKQLDHEGKGVTSTTIRNLRDPDRNDFPHPRTRRLLIAALVEMGCKPPPEVWTATDVAEQIAIENDILLQRLASDSQSLQDSAESVCILFADLVGSAEFKYGQGIADGLRKVHDHNMIVTRAVENGILGGTVVKFLGDGVMAFFRDHEGQTPGEAPSRAMKAALEVLTRIAEYNSKISDARWSFRLSTRIGIHYGPVWMLKFKEATRLDPQGPTVDLAARLCEAAAPMNIVLNKVTFDLLKAPDIEPLHVVGPQQYPVRGTRDVQFLFSLSRTATELREIPLPGTHELDVGAVQDALGRAKSNLARSQDVEQAIREFEAVLGISPRHFEANCRLAELLATQRHVRRAERPAQLLRASRYLDEAMASRPQSSYLWNLSGWVQYQQFRFATEQDPRKGHLERAVQHATHALRIAEGLLDRYGAMSAHVYLVIYLNERIRAGLSSDPNADLESATTHLSQARDTFTKASGGFTKATLKVGEALTALAQRMPLHHVHGLLQEALESDPMHALAVQVKNELLNG